MSERPEPNTDQPRRPRQSQRRITPRIDAGWLLLLSGVTLLAAALLIPAADELSSARWQRDRTIVLERAHLQRLDRHMAYLDALRSDDPALARALATAQLNLVPKDRAALDLPEPAAPAVGIFQALEPDPPILPARAEHRSTLARLALGPTSRLWLIALGALLTLMGLLPETPRRAGARPYRLST